MRIEANWMGADGQSIGIHANADGQVVITKIKGDAQPNQVSYSPL
jgi:hypothetical protein